MYITSHKGKVSSSKIAFPDPYHRRGKLNRSGYRQRWGLLRSLDAPVFSATDNLIFTRTWCREHRRYELVPQINYSEDLFPWYNAGRHPRFSIVKALAEAKQFYWEIQRLLSRRWGRPRPGPEQAIRTALRLSRTSKEFIHQMHAHLFSTLRIQRRRIRAENWFLEKYQTNTFTVNDFIKEQNQERRRFMLRHGIEIQSVLGRMKFLAEDSEGKLYQLGNTMDSLYLYVVCPSTKQEYLLSVPRGEWRNEPLPEDKWIKHRSWDNNELPESEWRKTEQKFHVFTPAEARRWTFDLPMDAEFMKEA